jgi:molybdopterin converting factor small subunit
MEVSVRLSSGLAQLAGAARLSVSMPEEATVGELIARLGSQRPELAPRLAGALPVIAGRHVMPSEALIPGAEVALLLPVSGG